MQQTRVSKGQLFRLPWVKEVARWLTDGVDVSQCQEDLDQLHAVEQARGSCGCVGKHLKLFVGKGLSTRRCGVCRQMVKPSSDADKRKYFVCK